MSIYICVCVCVCVFVFDSTLNWMDHFLPLDLRNLFSKMKWPRV